MTGIGNFTGALGISSCRSPKMLKISSKGVECCHGLETLIGTMTCKAWASSDEPKGERGWGIEALCLYTLRDIKM